jgi:hypothetical protein
MNLISQARSRLVIDLLVLRIGKSGRYPRRLAPFFFASLYSLHKGSRTFCHVGVPWIGHLDPGRPPGLHVRTQFGNYRPPVQETHTHGCVCKVITNCSYHFAGCVLHQSMSQRDPFRSHGDPCLVSQRDARVVLQAFPHGSVTSHPFRGSLDSQFHPIGDIVLRCHEVLRGSRGPKSRGCAGGNLWPLGQGQVL